MSKGLKYRWVGLRHSTGTAWLEERGMTPSGFTVEQRPDGSTTLEIHPESYEGTLKGFQERSLVVTFVLDKSLSKGWTREEIISEFWGEGPRKRQQQ